MKETPKISALLISSNEENLLESLSYLWILLMS